MVAHLQPSLLAWRKRQGTTRLFCGVRKRLVVRRGTAPSSTIGSRASEGGYIIARVAAVGLPIYPATKMRCATRKNADSELRVFPSLSRATGESHDLNPPLAGYKQA